MGNGCEGLGDGGTGRSWVRWSREEIGGVVGMVVSLGGQGWSGGQVSAIWAVGCTDAGVAPVGGRGCSFVHTACGGHRVQWSLAGAEDRPAPDRPAAASGRCGRPALLSLARRRRRSPPFAPTRPPALRFRFRFASAPVAEASVPWRTPRCRGWRLPRGSSWLCRCCCPRSSCPAENDRSRHRHPKVSAGQLPSSRQHPCYE